MRNPLPDGPAMALNAGITVYDATCLALAVRLEMQVIRGDDRCARRLAGDPQRALHGRSLRNCDSE